MKKNKQFLKWLKCISVILLVLFSNAPELKAQISLTSGTYSQDFNTLVNTGTSTVLPAGWLLSESGTNANSTYTAGTGSSTTGDSYSFGSALDSDRSLGGVQSGSVIPTIGAFFVNNSGGAINSLIIAYTGEQWRLGALSRTDMLTFQYSTDAASLATGTWTNFTALDFTAPQTGPTVAALVGNNAANRTALSSTITGLNIPAGATFYIRWSDFNASGADDGLGIDDFSLSFTNPCVSPVITCPSNISVTVAPGQCNAVVTYTATATGTSPSFTYSPASGSTFPIGTTSVTATATNSCGSSSCTFTVSVNAPEANVTGNSTSIMDGDVTPSATDFTEFGNVISGGNLVRTFTIQNTGTAPLTVSSLNSTNALFAVGALTPTGPIAASGSATFTVTFSPVATGLESAIITINNDDCNESVYDFIVQGTGVTACVPPVISCPASFSVNNTPGQCGASVNFNATASGSPAPVISYSIAPGSFFAPGSTSVTATATNSCGADNCTFIVTVTDAEPPVISCPANISGVVATSASGAVVNYTPPVGTDNCSGANTVLFSGLASGSTFPIGTSTVTYKVTDGAGLTATCSFTVTVIGAAPVVVCPANISIPATAGSCGANVSYAATDLVGIPASSISYSIAPGSFFSVGAATTVTATATNVVGTSICNFTVTVIDNHPPSAICQNLTVALNASGTATITASQINNGSTDNCSIAGMTVSPSTFNCSNIVSVTTPADLFISEYIEGSGNNKSIEIFNGTGSTVNLTAGGYQLRVYSNGSSTPTIINLTGTINTGDVYVVSNNLANAAILAQTDLTSGSVSFNGDDAVALTKNGTTGTFVDIFGSIGFDPGTAWTSGSFTTIDRTLRRLSTVGQGITVNPATSFPQLGTEWIQLATDDISGVGSHALSTGTPVTLTVTDVNGNSASCTANVTVVDNIPPVVICQNATVTLDATGNGILLASQVNNGSTDNCSIASITVSPNAFTCANVGIPVTVTLTVTDVNGNSNSCTSTVTVIDNTPPVAVCQNATVTLNAAGTATLTATQINNGSYDNCSIATMTVTPNTFNCSNIVSVVAPTDLFISEYIEGSSNNKSIEIYNGTGASVNLTTGGYQLRVYSNGSTTPAIINLSGSVAAGDVYIVSNSSANAGILAQTDLISGSVSFNGDDAVALTKNGATGTFVDIFGSIGFDPGTAWIQGSFTTLDRTLRRLGSISQGITINPATGFPQLGTDWVQFATDDIAGLGAHSLTAGNLVTLTVTDASGLSSTCTANVTVVDNLPPTAVCQNATVILDANGNGTLTASQVNNGSTDNCGIATLTVSPNTFTCANVGTPVTVTLTVTDVNGLSSTCTSTVTIIDNLPPVAVCQNATVILDASGNGSVTSAQINNGSSDNCGIASMTVSPNTFNCASISGGTTPSDLFISEYIEGSSNNKCVEIFNGTGVAVNLTAGGYQLQYYFNGAVVSGLNIPLTGTIAAGDVYVVCQSTSAAAFLAQADQTNASSWYNGDDAIVLSKNSGLVTVDIFGRIGEDPGTSWGVSPLVTVDKTLRRNSNVTAGVTSNPAAGFPTLSTQWTSSLIDDATGLGAHTLAGGTGSAVVPVVLTVTDVHGLTSTCNANVTVVDNTPPSVICQNISVNLNASGTASITAAQINNGSTDACGIASSSVTPSTFSCANLGPNTVTLTVTDINGNSASCTATVTVVDNTAPLVNCQNVTVVLDASGNGSITAAQINNGSSDNCSISTLAVSQTDFDCSDIGSGIIPTDLIISEYTEGSSNNKCIEIYNGTGSTINLTTGGYQLQVYSNGSITPTNITLTGSLAPGQVYVVCNPSASAGFLAQADQTSGSLSFNGDDAVALFKNSTSQLLDIIGTIGEDPGTAWTAGTNQTLDRTLRRKLAVLTGVTINPASGFPTLASEWDGFAIDNLADLGSHTIAAGTNVVTLTFTDGSGNSSSCLASVTVVDNILPVITCPVTANITVDAGLCTSSASIGMATATDNCSATVSGPVPAGPYSIGTTVVTWTATDPSGNSVSCTQTVYVTDTQNPVITLCAPAQNVNLTGTCQLVVPNLVAQSTATDNCSVTITQSPLAGTSLASSHNQTHVITITATDAAGNAVTCTTTLTGKDVSSPVITVCAPNQNVNLTGSCQLVVPNLVAQTTATDNCTVTVTQSPAAGTILASSHNQSHNIVINAVDAAGNSVTCTTTLTGKDVTSPLISCQGNISTTNGAGLCGAVVSYAAPVGSDNCTYTITQAAGLASGALFPIGTVVNTFVATDAAGNTATCSFSVTVADIEFPIITSTLADTIYSCNPVTWTPPTITDNCLGLQVTSTHTPGTNFGPGTTQVTYTATDAYNNTSTYSFYVTRYEESVAPASMTSDRAFNNICAGESINLTINGGSLGAAATWKWYTGTCGGTALPAFSGMTSINVTPSVTTTYFARAEGLCDSTACVSVTVVVSTTAPNGVVITSVPPIAAVGQTGVVTCNIVPGATFYRWTSILGHINAIWFNGGPGPVETATNSVNVAFQLPQSNYQIRVIAGNACGRSNNASAHIRGTVPAPTCLVGPVIACQNSSATYSVATCPIAGTNGYQWTVTGAGATISSGQGTATITVAFGAGFNNATVCVSGVSTFGLAGPQTCLNVTNNALSPTSITGNNAPCQNSLESYTSSVVPGATSYLWSTTGIAGATASGTTTTGSVQFPSGAFSGQVCVQAVSGCGTSAAYCFNVASGVAISPGVISTASTGGLCGASNVNFSVVAGGANNYNWVLPAGVSFSNPTGNNANSVNLNFTTGLTAPLTIKVWAIYDCDSAMSSITVSGTPEMPTVTSAGFCAGALEYPFASSTGNNLEYTWTFSGVAPGDTGCLNSPGCSSYYVQWPATGGSVTVTATNTCGTSLAFYGATTNCVRLAGDMDTKVYPNPTDGNLTIEFTSHTGGNYNMTITDLTGRVVINEAVKATSGKNERVIDLGFANPGMYMLYLQDANGDISVHKVTKE